MPAPKAIKATDSVRSVEVGIALFLGLAIGLVLFVFVPNLLAEQVRRFGITSGTTINLISGLVKIVVFLAYIWGIGRMADIHRLFRYHGAEHKAINTLEAGQDLTMDNCKLHTRLHPRCGTSFAIVVLLVSILVFTYIPRYPLGQNHPMLFNVTLRFALELVVLPLVAGISYELIRWAGRMRSSAVVSALFKPGLMTQHLTTVEPEEDQIEVALIALSACIDAEEHGLTENA